MNFSFERCRRFIETIETLDIDDPQGVLDAVSEVGLTFADFVELDERPGQWDGKYDKHNWHVALRRVRNGENDLFERIKQ